MHIFWGIAFTVLGMTELVKKYEIVYGIPIWALCFFIIAASNFLSDPYVRSKINIPDEKLPLIMRTFSILNRMAIGLLIISFIIEFIRS
ncbi:MAG: hypothetical protein U5O15_01415 [Candidatus Krumholzibacteriota bacterium]|nr:hypothetical protein [Candidatus Krumholzibacteriota bacterium]